MNCARRPGFALTAVLSLALGIGATSAVFSVVYGVLINPFPYVGADRMMQISLVDNAGRFRGTGMSGAQVEQLRQARTVESVVAEDGWNLTTPMAISPRMSHSDDAGTRLERR